MLCTVGYTLAVKRLSAHYPALFLTAAQAFIGSVLYLPLLPFAELTGVIDGPAMLAVLYLGAVVSVLGHAIDDVRAEFPTVRWCHFTRQAQGRFLHTQIIRAHHSDEVAGKRSGLGGSGHGL